MFAQLRHDPDADALGNLMQEWYSVFGSAPTTVRKLVDTAQSGHLCLLDAISEFPVIERGEVNRPKLGWLLKKNSNRIIKGYEIRKAEADGRVAWQVVMLETPPSPPLPPS
ncbi:MAG: hypothetical protein KI789_00260 [Hoeflea sp.]|nr:hypothetical protein [Hoeflea sp.]